MISASTRSGWNNAVCATIVPDQDGALFAKCLDQPCDIRRQRLDPVGLDVLEFDSGNRHENSTLRGSNPDVNRRKPGKKQRAAWPVLLPLPKTIAGAGTLAGAEMAVEAVGIEPSSVHPVSHDSVAITRNGPDAHTPLKRSESEWVDQLGTRVLKLWGALRVV